MYLLQLSHFFKKVCHSQKKNSKSLVRSLGAKKVYIYSCSLLVSKNLLLRSLRATKVYMYTGFFHNLNTIYRHTNLTTTPQSQTNMFVKASEAFWDVITTLLRPDASASTTSSHLSCNVIRTVRRRHRSTSTTWLQQFYDVITTLAQHHRPVSTKSSGRFYNVMTTLPTSQQIGSMML